ncbi:MAG: hypothetical protein GY847_22870 [Proteobacteria bacterium]|nr:hypothetical protein [Pseudomonadota bacterium]
MLLLVETLIETFSPLFELLLTPVLRAEAIQATEEGELSFYDSEDDADPLWFDESVWTEPYHILFISVRAPIQQPLFQFISGCGFVTYLVCPILRASAL